jgi:hypothetical protein
MKPTDTKDKAKEVKVRSEKEILTDILAAIDSGDDNTLLKLIDEYQRTYGSLPEISARETTGSSVDAAATTAGRAKSILVDDGE